MQLILVQPRLSHDPGTGNFDTLAALLEPVRTGLASDDVLVLPEHVVVEASAAEYRAGVAQLARTLGCHVIGGSHHEARATGERVNSGVVCDPNGQPLIVYEKLRPYANERQRVQSGGALGEVTIGGRRMLVLICADFWFSDVFARAHALPDLVLVPAYSVSRKPTPDYSRQLWRQLAVARAYEFGVYVGVSDWAHVPVPGVPMPSGVAGLADPTTIDPAQFFTPVSERSDSAVRRFTVDFARLDAFRADRIGRGFFWKKPDRLPTE